MKKLSKLLFVFVLGFSVQAIAANSPGSIIELPVVDLSEYESDVAEQLADARANVDQLIATPGPDAVKLSQSYGYLGKLYHAYGLLPAAQVCYNNAGAIKPKQFEWPYLYAVVANQQGQQVEAVKALKYALTFDKENLAARLRLAKLLREGGDYEGAYEHLSAIENSKPSLPVVQAELGELALAKGENQTAVQFLESALKQIPGANRLHYPLAIALRNLGEVDKARDHMGKRGDVGISITDPLVEEIDQLKVGERVHLLRGKLAFASGDYLAAAKAFTTAVEAKPDSARAYVNLGTTLFAMGQAKESRQQFIKALEIDPNNVTAHYNLGTSAFNSGQFDNANKHLSRVVALSPQDIDARLMLAQLLQQQQKFGAAFEQFQSIAKLNQKSQAAWMGMVSLLTSAEQYSEALMVLKQAHEALPYDGRISHARARMLAASPDKSLRDGRQARRLAYQAYNESPSLDRAYTVSLALAESGECTQAASFLEQAWPNFSAKSAPAPEKVSATVSYYGANDPCRSAPIW